MAISIDDIFNSQKSALEASKNVVTPARNKMVLQPPPAGSPASADGYHYVVRLLPYTVEGVTGLKKTMFHYIKYSWTEVVPNEMGRKVWHTVTSPKTFNERCFITDWSYRSRSNSATPEERACAKDLQFRQGWYVNAYVISDPVHPENNGTVKYISLTKTLYNMVENAIKGGLDAQWSAIAGREINVGKKVYDISDNGLNFDICVKLKGGFPNYDDSKFIFSSPLGLTQQQQEQILASVVDVTKIEPVADNEANIDLFKRTFMPGRINIGATPVQPAPVQQPVVVPSAPVYQAQDVTASVPVTQPAPTPTPSPAADLNSQLDAFLSSVGTI